MKKWICTALSFYLCSIAAQVTFAYQSNPETLFQVLNPEHSKVNFNNELKDTKEQNIMIYSNFYGGAGVGIGDINNDDLPDLFFAGNLVGDALYINKGALVFEDITKSSGVNDNGGWSSGVIMADINQDGWLDIYVTRELYDDNENIRRNLLYINNKDNTFSERAAEYNLDNNQRTRHATFLDYDKDGDLDLFLLNQPPNPGDYSQFYKKELLLDAYRPVLYQNNDGKFEDVTIKAGFTKTGFPNSVTASDLNGDGWTDLFVANDFWVGDWYYINNGDGTFTDQALKKFTHTSFSSMGVDAADINNDGKLDIGVVDMVAEDNYRAKANMSGMNPKAFQKVVDDGGHYQYMFNMLHLNRGDGHFSDIAQMANMASTDWSWSILMADLDNDGWKDIHITNGLMRDIRNKDASKTLPDYLEAALHDFMQKNTNPGNVGIWDIVNIDTALSLVPSEKLSNYVFRNNGDLTFKNKVKEWGFDQKTFSNGSAYADLDNDGDLDIVVNNINDIASIYENRASTNTGNKYLRIKPVVDAMGVVVEGVKVNVYHQGSIQFSEITGVRGMYSTSEQVAHFGVGTHSRIEKVVISWPDGKENILTNIETNQEVEVLYSMAKKSMRDYSVSPLFEDISNEKQLDYRHVENDFDDFRMQLLLPHKMSSFGPHISVGDINGDAREDLFIGGSATKKGAIMLQNIDGSFVLADVQSIAQDSLYEDIGSTFFDADGDGDLDLFVVSGGNEFMPNSKRYMDRLYLNDGTGEFVRDITALPAIFTSGSKVIPEDFDHDGDIDLFVAGRHKVWSYPEPVSSYLLRNDGGKFTDITEEIAPALMEIGMVNDAKWSDQNGDGWKDLVIVGEWMPLTILLNMNGKFVRSDDLSLNLTAGWWFSVETEDMDGDGDIDIIAGNLGLNYKYKASEEEPFGVYFYDFDQNNKKDIVLTYYNFGIEYPLRGMQCSSEQVPEIKENFETYDLFASSNVGEVYGENELESALHYDAFTFASTYFENKGDGSYEAKVLPAMAQLSSVNDMVIDDFNKDGKKDILLAGNLYGAEVETTRNDAGHGLLLLGNGKGDFQDLNAEESGFFIPADVKSLAKIENSRGYFIFLGCNNESVRTFKLIDNSVLKSVE